jgi:hypothetical protein
MIMLSWYCYYVIMILLLSYHDSVIIRVSSKTRFAFCFAKLDTKRVSLFRETNWLFREISCFAKQPVSLVSLFLVRSSYLRDNPIFPDPVAPAPTLLYS